MNVDQYVKKVFQTIPEWAVRVNAAMTTGNAEDAYSEKTNELVKKLKTSTDE